MNKLRVFLVLILVLCVIYLFNKEKIDMAADRLFVGDVYIEEAREHMAAEDYEAAIMSLDRYLRMGVRIPDSNKLKSVYVQKASALKALYLNEVGQEYVDRAMAIGEVTFDEKVLKADFLLANGKYEEALVCYDELIAMEPRIDFLSSHAACNRNLDKIDEACAEYEAVLEQEPTLENFKNLLYTSYSWQDDDKTAAIITSFIDKIENHQAIVEDRSEAMGTCYQELGYVNESQLEYEAAIENFNTAISYMPEDSYSYFELALCYAALGNHQAAAENLEQAITMDEDYYYLDEVEYYDEFKDFLESDFYEELRRKYY